MLSEREKTIVAASEDNVLSMFWTLGYFSPEGLAENCVLMAVSIDVRFQIIECTNFFIFF